MRFPFATLAALALLVLLVVGVGLAGGAVLERVAIDTLIKLVTVVGLSVFIGNSGVLSFGHASFAALGAYSAAWFTLPLTTKKLFLPKLPGFILSTQLGLPGAAAIGMAVAAIFALLVGVVVVRLTGIAASIATLAWLAIVNTVLANADSLTKGTSSLVGLPLVVGPITATVSALGALVVALAFKVSRTGLMLQASREDEAAALASGIPVKRVRLIAFVLSAALVALGGILQGHFLGVLTVAQFYFEFTFLTLAMLVMGGMRSVSGAVVGTIVVAVVSEVLRVGAAGFAIGGLAVPSAPGLREIGLALIMLAVLMLRPRGIMSSRELTLGFLRRKR
jgi:branched-chain amino acid transport system permease protein